MGLVLEVPICPLCSSLGHLVPSAVTPGRFPLAAALGASLLLWCSLSLSLLSQHPKISLLG